MNSLQKQLDRLQKTSIIGDIFKIGSVDEIATIGGYRLGITQRVYVSWEEINAALGQLVYLLCVLAHDIGFKLSPFQLHVNGAYSKISTINKPDKKYDLHYGASETNFNSGLKYLLQCVKSFIEWIETKKQKDIFGKEQIKKFNIADDKID